MLITLRISAAIPIRGRRCGRPAGCGPVCRRRACYASTTQQQPAAPQVSRRLKSTPTHVQTATLTNPTPKLQLAVTDR